MNDEVRAEIAAAAEWHRVQDVARYYGISMRTVQRIAEEVEPAYDFPNIPTVQTKAGVLTEDVRILKARGLTDQEAGDLLGVSKTRVWQIRHGL